MADVQQLVDQLAERLQRSVAVDTPRGHLIASSKHFGDEDTPRINVVLSRDLEPRVAKYLFSFGIRSASENVLIPAKPELGLKARCCYPLRHHRRLLGFIWLIDDCAPDDVVRPYADQIAEALGQQEDSAEADTHRLTELGRQLLSTAYDANHVATALTENGFASVDSLVRVVAVAQPLHRARSVRFPVLRTSGPAREWMRPGRDMIEVDLDAAAVLICARRAGDADEGLDRLITRLAADLNESGVRIGMSAPGKLLESRALLRQALLAAYAGHIFGELGHVNSWTEMFPHRVLMEMALAFPQSSLPPEGMAALFDPANAVLLETVEAYLDHGGDRTASAAALFIHRSTLYYRLSQVQKLTGLDPANGRSQLALQIAIKLQRIAGSGVAALLQNEEDSV